MNTYKLTIKWDNVRIKDYLRGKIISCEHNPLLVGSKAILSRSVVNNVKPYQGQITVSICKVEKLKDHDVYMIQKQNSVEFMSEEKQKLLRKELFLQDLNYHTANPFVFSKEDQAKLEEERRLDQEDFKKNGPAFEP